MYRARLLALAGAFSLASTAAVADDTGLAYSHTLRKEGGRTCMADHYHSGSGEGRTKEAARAAAVRPWIESGRLVVSPLRKRKWKYSLDELLSEVTEANVHPETTWGLPVGDEVW